MNTRSQKPNNIIPATSTAKPYVTQGNSNNMAAKHTPDNNAQSATPIQLNKEVDFSNLSTDEKLDLLLHAVNKMSTIPKDIVDINARITELTTTVNDIPRLKTQVQENEVLLKTNEEAVNANKNKIANIETSITFTQGMVENMGKQIKEMETKMANSSKVISQIESRLGVNEKLLLELEKQFADLHNNKEKNARSIIIQGIPEGKGENLKVIVHQILFDTDIKVPWTETDEIYRDGYYNKRRSRPVKVTFTRKAVRDEVYRARNNTKKNPKCKDIWINELISEEQRQQRNELKALFELALLKGYTARYHMDTIVVNGITYEHATINKLPQDLTLELAYSREIENLLLFHSEHVFLSNFYPCNIKIEMLDITFGSLEQAYFYLLAKETGNVTKAHLILKTTNPRKIKRIGGSIVATPEWLRKSDQVMFDLLGLKFKQNPELRQKLLATEGKTLVEATLNKYWGCGLTISMADKQIKADGKIQYPGSNWLGHQVADIRRDIRLLSKQETE